MSAVGARYARALVELARDNNEVEAVRKQLTSLAAAWTESADLRSVFENPVHDASVRTKVLEQVGAKLGLGNTVKNTMLLLGERQRITHLPDIAESYDDLAERETGRVRGEVISATPLSADYVARLEKALEGVTGKKVTLVPQVDPELIGGVVTRVGDQVFDGSVKHGLGEMKERLLAE